MASHPLLYNVRSLDKSCHLQSPAFLFLLSWSLHASLHSYHRVFPVFINDSSSAPRWFFSILLQYLIYFQLGKDGSPERSSENIGFLLLIVLLSFVLPHSCLVLQTSTTQFPVIFISNYFTIFTKNKKNYPDICEKIFVKHRLHLHYCEKRTTKTCFLELVILHEILI